MPVAEQRALFISALLAATTLVAGSYLNIERVKLQEKVEALREEIRTLEEAELEPTLEPLPHGPGANELKKIALGLPKGLWLTELSADRDLVSLTGKATNPYLPLEFAEQLHAELTTLARGEEGLFDWEVKRVLAPEAR